MRNRCWFGTSKNPRNELCKSSSVIRQRGLLHIAALARRGRLLESLRRALLIDLGEARPGGKNSERFH
jgi:hypothetical protein